MIRALLAHGIFSDRINHKSIGVCNANFAQLFTRIETVSGAIGKQNFSNWA
jgi:hypothetical protein